MPTQNIVVSTDNNIRTPDVIETDKKYVIDSYQSAISSNYTKFKRGDERATSEYIYKNQKDDAKKIVEEIYLNNRRVISITKKTKVGMDGLMIEIAKLMCTYPDNKFIVDPTMVRIITGMSNAGWEKDMKEKSPECFRDIIFHHGKLQKADFKNIKNGLFIFDEADSANGELQVLHQTLKDADLLDVEHMEKNNNRFVFASATMLKELYDLYPGGDLHYHHKMTIPDEYIGHKEFLEKGIIKEFFPLTTLEKAETWIQEDILDNYGSDYRVHIVRLNNKTTDIVQNACIRKKILFKNHTSSDRLADEEIKELFKEPLSNHVVLGVLGFFRRANLIPNKWKERIGATHELYTKNVDNNVQIQGLPGRMTGYWKNVIEGGHKTGPHRTSIKAVEEYEKSYNNPFGPDPYQSNGFKKGKKGKVLIKKPTMISPKNIKNLVAGELPEVKDETDFGVSDPYINIDELKIYLKTIIPIGKITSYTNNNNTIQYRGTTIALHKYVSNEEFVKLDINAGISKTVNESNIVCRIMPVIHNGTVKWLGIYSLKGRV